MYQFKHLRVRHLQIIEYMLANPSDKYEDISQRFGVSVPWISVLYRSRLFQTKLAQRMKEHEVMTDLSVMDQVQGVAQLGLEKLANCLAASGDPDFILDATDKLLRRSGYGTAAAGTSVTINQQNNSVHNVLQVDSATLAECRALLNGEAETVALPSPPVGDCIDVQSTPVYAEPPALEARAVASS